jgi:alanine racemase
VVCSYRPLTNTTINSIRPTEATIDLRALADNLRLVRGIVGPETGIIAVVKADGYGHGAADIARGLLAEGITRLAVVSVAEGAELRRAGIVTPILLMGGLDDRESAQRALKWSLTPVLHDERGVELALSLGRRIAPLGVEIEVDTGMRRMGVTEAEASGLLQRVAGAAQLSLAGVFTHLARADEEDVKPSREQVERFHKILEDAGDRLGTPTFHVANSAGLLRREAVEDGVSGFATQAVRPGIMLYGVSPFADRTAEDLDLRPVMSCAARVV